MTDSTRQPARGGGRSSHRSRWILWSLLAAVLVAGTTVAFIGAFGAVHAAHDIQPGIDQTSATLLQLDDIHTDHIGAPDYTLTDQNGKPMTASEFHGRSVVLTFNDDQCKDLCTLLAQNIAAADHDLGAAAKRVAFVSINANPYYPQVSAVKAWSDGHGLGKLKNWYFGTGTPASLSAIWQKYGVPVELNPQDRTVVHGSEIFFIDPAGTETALGQFGTESADTAPFAHAMAQMAVDLLPAADRTSVAGPSLPAATNGGTEIGATPAPTRLSDLRKPADTISTSAGHGTYTVLNFWASTCTACIQELPALEHVHHGLGKAVTFLGIDVSDTGPAGLAFADHAGVTYPLLNDTQGTAAGQYRITGLPYTVILDTKGKIVIRHAGAFTTEQLEYLLQSLDPKLGNAN